MLAAVGNLIGPGPHALVEHDTHPLRLNIVLVGRSSKGRKGGEPEKRLLIIEPEFALVLKNMMRQHNSLSTAIRLAWDSGDLSTLTHNSPLRASSSHVGIIGHITEEELPPLPHRDGASERICQSLHVAARAEIQDASGGGAVPDAALAPLIEELREALTFWRHAEASARQIFAGLMGSSMADVILDALREPGPMSETEIHGLFGRNKSQAEIRRALGGLQEAGKVGARTERTQGRPATTWERR